VYAFFISAAIIEEMVYRGFLVMLVQALLARLMRIKIHKGMNGMKLIIPNVIAILISGSIFMAVHTNYYADPFLMALTFVGGCSQALWYIKTKNLSVQLLRIRRSVTILKRGIVKWRRKICGNSWLSSGSWSWCGIVEPTAI
jgi:membrane protease YdiL (CAAX protease family)